MKFLFEPNLSHQREAVNAIVKVFEGAPYTRPEERFWNGEVSRNIIKLPPQEWYENAKAVAAENAVDGPASCDEPDFTIEMETGTGKTYVYLRAIFELNRRYGLHKFLIVVPSVAIREGTLAQLRQTKQHFSEIYATLAEVIEYDSKKLPQVRGFCVSNHLSIMVMNKQAFDSDKKIINDEDRDGGNLLEMLQQVQPIIIMDEPQEGMDTENMQKRLAAFNPLFKLRFSATHRLPKNIVYQLTPYDAYNRGLVKKIGVLSIHESNTQSNVSIEFRKIKLNGDKEPTATLQLNQRLKGGEFKSKAFTVKRGDDLEKKTGNAVYHGWVVEDIGTTDIFDGDAYIKFTNGEQLEEGKGHGIDKEAVFREQIRRSIQAHFKHKDRVVPLGIKPLSLFFIDRVANYVAQDGLIRRLFVEEYGTLFQKKYGKEPADIPSVHNGYFAQNTSGEFTDSERSMATNKEIYDKILRDKETLLSFDEPLEFIFSHSALGVGWDNPNVFTICTLNESQSVFKKRQEIGRGLRLSVKQDGTRYRDPESTKEGQEVNLLTVVANQSYHAFASTYQEELREELGQGTKTPPTRNLNKTPVKLTRRADRFSSEDFTSLWALIAQKTKCRVHFNETDLIERSIERLSTIVVDENRLEVSLTYWDSFDETGDSTDRAGGTTRSQVCGSMAQVDIVGELARNTALSEVTAAKILVGLSDISKRQLAKNPMQFLADAAKRIKAIMADEMVRLVRYEKTGDIHPFELLEEEIETVLPTVETPKRGLYDRLIYDSDVEKRFAGALDEESIVRVFLKLPKEYKIPMPFGGTYNPDFALVIQKTNLDDKTDSSRFYFTVETKGASEFEKLKEDEKLKIRCAVRHFEAIGLKGYLAPVEDLPSFDTKARERVGETFFNR
jgi:type III restriction enzyme